MTQDTDNKQLGYKKSKNTKQHIVLIVHGIGARLEGVIRLALRLPVPVVWWGWSALLLVFDHEPTRAPNLSDYEMSK